MLARFQIEQITTIREKVYILCRFINEEVEFYLTDNSYLGPCPIEKSMDMSSASNGIGDYRRDFFAFVLKNPNDKRKLKTEDILELWDDYVEVSDSFKLSDNRIIALLKCYPGKHTPPLEVQDEANKRWIITQYLQTTGSFKTYEIIREEEKKNIFQYIINPIDHEDKPLKGAQLKIIGVSRSINRLDPLTQGIVDIILRVKEKITDDSDIVWTRYNSPEELRNDIDKYLTQLKTGDLHALEEFQLHFSPTCSFQEHSMSNDWSKEYLIWAEEFDKLYDKLKSQKSSHK